MFSGPETTKTIITIKQQGMADAVSGLEKKAERMAISNLLIKPCQCRCLFLHQGQITQVFCWFSLPEFLRDCFILSFWSRSRSTNGNHIYYILIFMSRYLFCRPSDSPPTLVRNGLFTRSEEMQLQPFTCPSFLQYLLCKPMLAGLYFLNFLSFPK